MNHREFLRQFRQSGKENLVAQITPDSANDETRTVDCIWFSGADVPRYDWWTDSAYTLSFEPKGADLSRLNNRAPVCNNHCSDEIDCQLGVVLSASKKGSNYVATLQFKRSTELTGPRPDIDGIWQDLRDGILSKFSMGVELLETVDTRGAKDKLEIRTATSWRPFEISLTSIPADFNTSTLSNVILPSASLSAERRQRQIDILRLR